LLVDPGAIEQLAEAMQVTIESESLRLSLGDAARATVRPYEVSQYCDRLVDIFQKSWTMD
jgi:glycosyltransferase involved in cell wall biosynthesis